MRLRIELTVEDLTTLYRGILMEYSDLLGWLAKGDIGKSDKRLQKISPRLEQIEETEKRITRLLKRKKDRK